MKDKVQKILVKWGNNEKDVEMMIDDSFDYAISTYPEANPAFIADMLSTLR